VCFHARVCVAAHGLWSAQAVQREEQALRPQACSGHRSLEMESTAQSRAAGTGQGGGTGEVWIKRKPRGTMSGDKNENRRWMKCVYAAWSDGRNSSRGEVSVIGDTNNENKSQHDPDSRWKQCPSCFKLHT